MCVGIRGAWMGSEAEENRSEYLLQPWHCIAEPSFMRGFVADVVDVLWHRRCACADVMGRRRCVY